MTRTIPATLNQPFRRWLAANSADTSFTAPAATTTKPTAGVIELSAVNGVVPTYLLLNAIGTGADDSTYDCRIIGWSPVTDATGTELWQPNILYAFSATLSAFVGVAAATVVAAERTADALSVTVGNANVDYVVTSAPAANTPAHLMLDTKGYQLLQAVFDMTGATGGNLLWKSL